MGYDKFRNNSKELHSGASIDGLAEFPLSQLHGVYVGVVKDIIYTSRNGHIRVWIPDFGGDPESSTSWRDVIYASPYMGRTLGDWPQEAPANASTDNTYTNAGQSYGFFMVPPDTGNEVLCFFSTNRLEGYWFACLNSSKTRQMTPAYGAVSVDRVEIDSIPDYLRSYIEPSWNIPVGESVTNYTIAEGYDDPDASPKPINENLTLQYLIQGLISDVYRGPINSSSQRDPVSSVFGFSSPGRPIASQDPALNEDLLTRIRSGEFDPADLVVRNRYAGHSFVLDDGDILGNNNLVRLRTAAGHQLLMHDTEGFIYVSNSAGTAWIELTAGGDILVYGANDLAIRTQGNIMMTSDRSISFDALENLNLKAGAVQIESLSTTISADSAVDIYGKVARFSGDQGTIIASGGAMRVRAQTNLLLNAGQVRTTNGSPGGPVSKPDPIPSYYLPEAKLNELLWYSDPDSVISINTKVPTHEPYVRENITQTIENQTQITEAFTQDIDGNFISPPIGLSDSGIEQADNVILTDPAPTEAFITEKSAVQSIGTLDINAVNALNAQIAYNESNGDYNYFNQDTVSVGKFGVKTSDLIQSGYLKEGTPDTAEALQNPNNWRGQDGINNLDNFLSSSATQDQVQNIRTKNAYADLQSTGLITAKTTPEQAAGLVNATLKTNINDVVNWSTRGTVAGADQSVIPSAYKRGVYSISQKQYVVDSN